MGVRRAVQYTRCAATRQVEAPADGKAERSAGVVLSGRNRRRLILRAATGDRAAAFCWRSVSDLVE